MSCFPRVGWGMNLCKKKFDCKNDSSGKTWTSGAVRPCFTSPDFTTSHISGHNSLRNVILLNLVTLLTVHVGIANEWGNLE